MCSRLPQVTRTLISRSKLTTRKAFVLRHSITRPRVSIPYTNRRAFTGSLRTMASDEDYASFLEKANQDPSGGKPSTQSTKKVSTKSVDTEVPKVLEQVDEYYTSDADEPFEPVSLKWKSDKLPSAGMSIFPNTKRWAIGGRKMANATRNR